MSSSPQQSSRLEQQRPTDPYYTCSRRVVVPQQPILVLPGLFTFPVAATILRMAHAREELDPSATTGGDVNTLGDFFDRLDGWEANLETTSQRTNNGRGAARLTTPSLVVVVEGLDGSGKSTLVRELSVQHNNVVCWSTPSQTLSDVRPVFDKCGGAVARAFYMVSNYVLQYEIHEYDELHHQPAGEANHTSAMTIHIVDRWVTSTIAYSVAWNFLDIDVLPASAFGWPHDVRPPDLLLILQIDDAVRRERVHLRNECSRHNPWDQRLDEDISLGQRIVRSFERVGEDLSSTHPGVARVACLDANASAPDVLRQAVQEIHTTQLARQHQQPATLSLQYHHQHTDPSVPTSPFHRNPLQFFRQVSSELQLCDLSTGRRFKHALWNLQVAWNIPTTTCHNDCCPTPPPLLKTVGIQAVDATGILYCTRRDDTTTTASMVWCGGQYPFEQQWRAEGLLVPMLVPDEPPLPPPSLMAYVAACCTEVDCAARDTGDGKLTQRAARFRSNTPANWNDMMSRKRFVPLRMEVLMGGPSSLNGGPRRYEWTRGLNRRGSENRPRHQEARKEESADHDASAFDDITGWSSARSIIPFRPPGAAVSTWAFQRQGLAGCTVALTGTHCSGKATLGRAVAKRLGWCFHGELGDALRDPAEVTIPAGYKAGYSSGADSWDDKIYNAEVVRDQRQDNGDNRIVETWHVGNVGWAKIRLDASGPSEDLSKASKQNLSLENHYERAKCAIKDEIPLRQRFILAVHVSIHT